MFIDTNVLDHSRNARAPEYLHTKAMLSRAAVGIDPLRITASRWRTHSCNPLPRIPFQITACAQTVSFASSLPPNTSVKLSPSPCVRHIA